MTLNPTRPLLLFPCLALPCLALCLASTPLAAQISLSTAVDLALRNNPRIKIAAADLDKATAALAETHDIYIPSLNAGAGLGESYGYSPNPPTLFTFNAQSLVYSASQFAYIRSARAGLASAQLSLDDARQSVAEDAALTFVSLDHDQQREAVLEQEFEHATRLVAIVQERLDAGHDTLMELTSARLRLAQLHLARIHAANDTANDAAHLSRLMGLPVAPLRALGGFPAAPVAPLTLPPPGVPANTAVAAAFRTAQAKQIQAFGDNRFLYRPQFSLIIQYNRYATFTNSFMTLNKLDNNLIGANEEVFGVQIVVPLFDKFRKAKARETSAEAARSLHEAENAQINALDGQSRLNHTIEELQARTDVASLEQQLAQQQLEVVQLQLTAPGPGPLLTPKDEQNSRIAERDKYLGVIDTAFQLHQAQISLLRQTDRLLDWLLHPGPPGPAPSRP